MNGILVELSTDRILWTEQYRGARLEAVPLCPGCETPLCRLTGWKDRQFIALRGDAGMMTPEGAAFNEAIQAADVLMQIGPAALSGNLLDLWTCDDGPSTCKTQFREGAKVFVLNIAEMPKV